MNTPPFKRKFADSSPYKVKQLLEQVKKDVAGTNQDHGKPFCFKTFHFFTALLPCLKQVNEEFKHFYNVSVLDLDVKDDLQRSKVINWCRTAKVLYPVKARADGNCLLHAVSLFLWGFEDRDLMLRRLVYLSLANDTTGKFFKRWLIHQRNMSLDRPNEFNPDMNSTDMKAEWENIIKAAEDIPLDTNTALSFQSLEGIHLYVLANILKRPIIVLADRSARSVYGQSMQKDNIGGIYLPLDWQPSDTCKSPITIAYSMNHFTPLLPQRTVQDGRATDSEYVIPLVYHDFEPIVLRFLLYTEEQLGYDLINGYLDTKNIPMTTADSILQIPVAKSNYHIIKPAFDIVQSHFEECQQIYQMWIRGTQVSVSQPRMNFKLNNEPTTVSSQNSAPQASIGQQYGSTKCQTPGCELYGSPDYGGICSECFKKYTVEFNRKETENRKHFVVEPSAPLASMPYLPSGNFSMMDENCQNFGKCGNKMSVNKYPFCHECQPDITPTGHPISQEMSSSPPRAVKNEPVDDSRLFGEGEFRSFNLKVMESNRTGPNSPRTAKCLSPSCENQGHQNYSNFCKECFSKHHTPTPMSVSGQEGPSSQTYLMNATGGGPSTGTPSPGDSNIQLFQSGGNMLSLEDIKKLGKCKSQECKSFGHAHLLGYCETCINKTKHLESLGTSGSCSASSSCLKFLCSAPGCKEERIKNEYGFCLQCFIKNKPPAVEVSKEPIPPPDNSTLESNTPLETGEIPQPRIVTSSRDKVKCASPLCDALIYPPRQLCDRCTGILQREHAESTRSRSLEVKRHKPVATFSSPMRGNLPVVTPRQTNTAPHLRPGLNCVEPGCDKYGDPSMSYRCTEHYRQAIFRAPPPRSSPYPLPSEVEQYNVAEKDRGPPVHTQLPQPFSPQQYNIPVSSSGTRIENSQYIQTMEKVEGSRKGQKCKTPSCNNYGNSSKQGYCNACYKERTNVGSRHLSEQGEYTCC
ncbi:tumor necrosis factor alpha-induced protein 3-like isoform X2 [Saccostrea echinata]|uniref:tumor necrosis factor alpha-induced protein 3-like isoform X2 n=1 Tax=Saccostrea echinata TaxID=191078 RepID=UPI002A83B02E|nr:tumor necrosis factor alpha-induced protein 3-like isoform X2 [Saccostrea echinata]